MKRQTEWNDEQEAFSEIYQALQDAGLEVNGSEEEGAYREKGTLHVTINGETYSLELWKHC
jgi:hypothetical protein